MNNNNKQKSFGVTINNYDRSLGYLRSIAMINVVLVHIFYHLNVFPGIGKSLLLFEMPLLFFLTGANNFSNYKGVYWKYIVCRLTKIYIPYLLFALINIIVLCVSKGFQPINLLWLSPVNFMVQPAASGLDGSYSVTWWFNVYICILFVIPFFKKFYDRFSNIGIKIIPLCVIFIIVIILTWYYTSCKQSSVVYWFLLILVYLFFTYIGAFYQRYLKELNLQRMLIISLVGFISLFILVVTISSTNFTWDIQSNKFPTNFIFILFGNLWLWFFIIFLKWITKAFDTLCKIKFFRFFICFYDSKSYLILLGHTLVFALFIFVFSKMNALTFLSTHQVLYFLISIIILYPLSLLSAYPFYPLDWIAKKINKKILNLNVKTKQIN